MATTPNKPPQILVLEDNPVQAKLYETILRAGHYEVSVFERPMDLMAQLDQLELPAAILLDIQLPEVDGVTVLQTLEDDSRWCLVPVILMTAFPTRDRVEAAQKLPVPPEGLLIKPCDPNGMLQLISAILNFQDAVYLLRSLQRRRLSLRLELRLDVESTREGLVASQKSDSHTERKLAQIRREAQSFRKMEGHLLYDMPAETRLALRGKIKALDQAASQCTQRLREAAARRKSLVKRRQDILTKQKAVRDLEHKIQSLIHVIHGLSATTTTELETGTD